MPQVITPAAVDADKDRESKNWFLAQKYRQLMNQLVLMRNDAEDAAMIEQLDVAVNALRLVFNQLVPDEQRIGLKRAPRRSA
jgi:hypothetical protein